MVYRVGSACFTWTEFARVLHELREDRRFAIASGFTESYRSQSRQVQSRKTLDSTTENETTKLRAKATLLEDGARHLIAQPSLEAARVELHLIETLLTAVMANVKDPIPLAFYACQKTENTLAVLWRGFTETLTYSNTTADTLSEILARGLTKPDYAGIDSRATFLEKFNESPYPSLFSADLDGLYGCALATLEDLPALLEYKKSMELTNDDSTIRGIASEGVKTLAADSRLAGRSVNAQDHHKR